MGDKIRIDIKRREGITQAIQRALVEKGAPNQGGVVKTSIWAKVQKYFVNEKEESSGDELSILHHKGTETDDDENIGDLWHTFSQWSIPTEVDDYIEIARSTWNKILKLVGLAPEEEAEAAEAEEHDDVTGKEVAGRVEQKQESDGTESRVAEQTSVPEPDDIDANPPVEDDNPPANINPPKVQKLKNDKKPPESEPIPPIPLPAEMSAETLQRLKTPDTAKSGQSVSNSDETTTEYDEQGRIVAEKDKNGKVLKEISRDESGNVIQIVESKYDEKGNLVSSVTRNGDGVPISERYNVTDKKGNNIRTIMLNEKHEITMFRDYEYDRKGRVTKEIKRDAEGNVTEYITYKYDSNGQVINEVTYDSDGTVISKIEKKYHKTGFVSSIVMTDKDGKYAGGVENEYTPSGFKQREITRNAEGKVTTYANYEYDSNGDCSRKICRDSDGKVIEYYEYKTDESGQRIYIKRDPSGKAIERGKAEE